LAEDLVFSFTTVRIGVASHSLGSELEQACGLRPTIFMRFDQLIDPSKVLPTVTAKRTAASSFLLLSFLQQALLGHR
jgi:hypothetical protein